MFFFASAFLLSRLTWFSGSSFSTDKRQVEDMRGRAMGSRSVSLKSIRNGFCAGRVAMHWEFSSVTQSCPTLWDPMNHSTPGLPVHHQLPEFTRTHAHRVGDAIQPSHPLSSPSPPAPNPSQYQGLFQWVNSSHEVAKVVEFQLQHQSFQWTPRTDFL